MCRRKEASERLLPSKAKSALFLPELRGAGQWMVKENDLGSSRIRQPCIICVWIL